MPCRFPPEPEEGAAESVAKGTQEVQSVSAMTVTAGAGPNQEARQLRKALLDLRRQVEDNFDYVGPSFAEEARKIHYGEVDPHSIYGETSSEEAEALREEGVTVQQIPWIPRGDS